jgi:hypothetical protein
MTGKIGKEGNLCINRNGELPAIMICPYKLSSCSHHCPHFGEPKVFSPNEITLDICMGKTLKFSALEDKR